jgi:hypothetical protein
MHVNRVFLTNKKKLEDLQKSLSTSKQEEQQSIKNNIEKQKIIIEDHKDKLAKLLSGASDTTYKAINTLLAGQKSYNETKESIKNAKQSLGESIKNTKQSLGESIKSTKQSFGESIKNTKQSLGKSSGNWFKNLSDKAYTFGN